MKLLPLSSQKDFILLYNGEPVNRSVFKQRSRTASPTRTPGTKSSSNSKKMHEAVGTRPHENISGNSMVSISSGISNHASPPVLQPIHPSELISTSPANKTSGVCPKALTTRTAQMSHTHLNKIAPKRVELRLGSCTWPNWPN